MLLHDIYSEPNAADPVLDERTVLDLMRPHGVRGSAVTGIDETGGEARVYVIDETLEFVGLIDFGDAYIGHPALDWRWPTHADHLTLLQGYGDDAPLTDAFMAAWRAGLVLSDMAAIATLPDRRPQALERLRDLVKTLA